MFARFMPILVLFALVASADAGEFNEKLNIGDAAPSWENLPATDGKQHSLGDLKDKDAIVLIFTCVSCPYAVEYEGRLNELSKQYGGEAGKVAFVGVCVNKIAADRLDKLTERAKAQQLAYPIMYDETQKIANDFGAIYTPEVYVLNKDRKIVYMGAIDDSADSTKVQKKYLEEAIVATLKGEAPPVKEKVAVGCRVRYVRDRK